MNDYGGMVRQLMTMATPVANKNNPLSTNPNPLGGTEGAGRVGTGGGPRMYNPDGSANAVGMGANARLEGEKLSDNPYFPGTKSFAAWEQGFKGE
jgi:hypothetical protein